MTKRSPSMPEVLAGVQRNLQVRIRTVVQGTIVTYDVATQTAVVQPAANQLVRSGEHVPMNVTNPVPVAFPEGGGWSISWALVPNDRVLLLVGDRDSAGFRALGGPYNPASARMHNLTDSFVWPGAGPSPDPITGLSSTDLIIRGPGGIAIQINPAGVISLAGGGPAVGRVGDAVSPSADMIAWMSQVATALNGIAPGSVAPPAPVEFATIAAGSALVNAG